ncbi:MAG: hypothetical protein ACREP3_12735 [Candidatus Binatia bacterium]
MLRVGVFLRNQAEFRLIDFLDRRGSRVLAGNYRSDRGGRGAFYVEDSMHFVQSRGSK